MTELNKFIDHTLLKPDAVNSQIVKLCQEACEYDFAAVCINPSKIIEAKKILGSQVKLATVIGFPLGADLPECKTFSAEKAIRLGVDEIDMVMNIGAAKENDWKYVENDILNVLNICRKHETVLKVIIETCLLSKNEIETISKIICNLGADYVKTSTGFSTAGAKLEDIELIKKCVGENCLIKASGGIKTKSEALAFIQAGANRIGTSSAVKMMNE